MFILKGTKAYEQLSRNPLVKRDFSLLNSFTAADSCKKEG